MLAKNLVGREWITWHSAPSCRWLSRSFSIGECFRPSNIIVQSDDQILGVFLGKMEGNRRLAIAKSDPHWYAKNPRTA